MSDFKFPDVGEGITEGTLLKWLVKVGDKVKEDQVLAEVETDKAVVEVPSPQAGTITKLHANPKDKIKVDDVLVTFDGEVKEEPKEKKEEPKEEVKEIPKEKKEEPKEEVKETPKEKPKPKPAPVREEAAPKVETQEETKEATSTKRALATPHTRRLAREMGVDLSTIQGTGPGGRITDQDVQGAKGGAKPATQPTAQPSTTEPTTISDEFGPTRREAMSPTRQAIANKMTESVTHAVHVTHHDIADVTRLVKVRESVKANARKRGVKLTFLPFIAKAAVSALTLFPKVNASLDEATNEIVYHDYYNLGMALATEAGLLVPVISGADNKSILMLGKEMHELADKGRARKLTPQDMQGSTFTITNVGSIGGTHFTPIINYPNAAILGVGRIKEEVRMKDGMPAKRHILYLSLSYDHRLIDGALAAAFMNELVKHLEDPDLMLVDVV